MCYEEFFRREYPLVVMVLMRVGATYEEAEDAAQRAMFDAYRQYHRLENACAWVRVAAVRYHIKEAQRDRERVKREAKAARLNPAPPSGRAEPDAHAWVLAVLRGLPPQQRAVLALTLDGFAQQEIAENLDMKISTVRSTLRHARQALRRLLGPQPGARAAEGTEKEEVGDA